MKKIIFLLIFFFLLIIIGNTIVSIISLWSKKDLLTQTQNQLAREENEHQQLLKQWQTVNTPGFIEEEARNKLFLAQPGDVEVVLPTATASGGQGHRVLSTKPIWLQWWELFF